MRKLVASLFVMGVVGFLLTGCCTAQQAQRCEYKVVTAPFPEILRGC